LLTFDEKLKSDFALNFATNIDLDYFFMNLKFEKDLEHIYFGTSKKRYYSIQRGSNKRYIRGLNIIRKDAPSFMKTSLDTLAELSVKRQLKLSHLTDLRKEIESTNYSELGISKSFGRRFSDYIKTMPQHVKAAVWANNILGTDLSNTDNPLLYYVNSKCEEDLKPRERQTAICLNEEDLHLIDKNSDKFELDYKTFFQKQVLDQVKEFIHIPEVKTVLEQYKEKEKSNG
jgi:DNA polymerase elongation subunit (family B)